MIEIGEKVSNKLAYDLVKELPARVEAIIHALPFEVAEGFMDELWRGAPSDIEGYPEMLEIKAMELSGLDGTAVISAPASAQRYRLKLEDQKGMVLYVKSKRIEGAPDPAAALLEKHNPWTMSTLPYEPERRQAHITARKVSVREIAKIQARRESEKAAVQDELMAMGYEPNRLTPLLTRRVARDIAFEVLRQEFGMGDRQSAHWRPALRKARTTILEEALKKVFIRWLAVPSETRWKKKLTYQKEKAKNAKRYQAFQDMVAGKQ